MVIKFSTTCAVASTLSIAIGITLLITGCIFVHDTSSLRASWKEIYSLSIYNVLISLLTIIFATSLLYVVNRKFPALTIVFSILMLVVVVFTIICLVVLAVGLHNLRHQTYYTTGHLLRNYSASNEVMRSQHTIGHIQAAFGCCDVNQATNEKNQLYYERNPSDSCCLIITTEFTEDTVIAINKHPSSSADNTVVREDKMNVRGFAEPVYSYLRRRYITLIVLDAFLITFLLTCAILGLISEYKDRQQYELM
ncbi:unnamed protein product [Rotaria sp. Silwood1]|nr:unnamed protein product [Rotaria sp. Silwood1]CAF4837323.1 unnamed protein product [Rotaria sp. Silwood1]